MLSICCATLEALGPTTPLYQKGCGDSRETHKGCNINVFRQVILAPMPSLELKKILQAKSRLLSLFPFHKKSWSIFQVSFGYLLCFTIIPSSKFNKEASSTASSALTEDTIHFILRLSIYYYWALASAKVCAISISLDIRLKSGDMKNRVQTHKGLRQGQFVSNLTNPLCNAKRTNLPTTQFA